MSVFDRPISEGLPRICEHAFHNAPEGCGNPECWKYQENSYDRMVKAGTLTREEYETFTIDDLIREGNWR
jgi:hypothetical protein